MYSTEYLGKILDKIPIGRFHRKLLAIAGAGFALDSMEVLVISFTLPLLIKAWNLDLASAGLLGSASLVGMLLGNLIWGAFSDRFGRKPAFEFTILMYSIFTGLSAFAPDYWTLFALRLLTGIGLGGCLAVDTTLLSENLPSNRRGRYVVLLDAFWPLGQVLAVALAWLVLPDWRLLFLVAAFPALLAGVVRLSVRETPFFLARQGKMDELRASLDAMMKENGTVVECELPKKLEETKEEKIPFSEVLSKSLRKGALMIAATWLLINFGYYGIFLWLPSILAKLGYTSFQLYSFILLSALVQFPGYFSAAYLIEKIGRKKTLASYLLLSGICAFAFAAVTDNFSMMAALALMSFFCLGAWGVIYAYTPELFPTRVRASGMGFAGGVGRIGAIAAAPLAGAVMAGYSLFAALSMLAAAFVLGSIVVWLFGTETMGKKLE